LEVVEAPAVGAADDVAPTSGELLSFVTVFFNLLPP